MYLNNAPNKQFKTIAFKLNGNYMVLEFGDKNKIIVLSITVGCNKIFREE